MKLSREYDVVGGFLLGGAGDLETSCFKDLLVS